MTSLEAWILAYLGNSLWQVPLLCLAGWIAARLVRPAGPAAEHRVWTAALLFQVAVPLLATFSWRPLWMRLAALFATLHRASAGVSVVIGPANADHPAGISVSIFPTIAVAYALLCAWFAARFLWRCGRLSMLRRTACPLSLPAEAAQFFVRCCTRLRVSDVALASSSRIAGPVALGVRRSLILFPSAIAADLHGVDLEAILAHELAHLRRRDFLVNWLCEMLALPIAWHPAMWFTRRRIAETRELACDRMAAELAGPIPYAQSLLRLASRLVPGAPRAIPHALGIFDTAVFERRLMRLTEMPIPFNGARRLTTLAVCAALALATCGSALALGLHPAGMPAPAATSNTTPTQVSPGDMAGRRISGPTPVYPEAAKKAHVQGEVILKAIIDRNGKVEYLDVVSGPWELQQSALDAVRRWDYRPYRRDGRAIAVSTTIHVIYKLGNGPLKLPDGK